MNTKPHAIIIGAGFTGCAVAHDLALRGFQVSVIERGDIANGTSGRTHGLLHSGGRYCAKDPEAGVECIQENIILRRIAKSCIEFNGGLFIALTEEDLAYAPAFEAGAEQCGIPIEKLTPRRVLELEPNLTPDLLTAYTVPDASFDPLRLALVFAATSVKNGAHYRTFTDATNLIIDGQRQVVGVQCWDRHKDQRFDLRGDIVVNATGSWAGQIAQMASVRVPVVPTPGVMVAYDQRLCQRVINRLAPPGDGDILIPQRRMLVIGTTSYEVSDVDYIPVLEEQVAEMNHQAYRTVPKLAQSKMRGAYMSSRPLIGSEMAGRSLSRTFKCLDHQASDGIGGLVTIMGGKATTCRAMAAATADVVCLKLGIHSDVDTREIVLEDYRGYYRN